MNRSAYDRFNSDEDPPEPDKAAFEMGAITRRLRDMNKVCDQSLPESEHSMSNFDHEIEDGMEEDLRNGYRSSHAGWDFYGLVWFEDGLFYEQVKRYCSHVATISAPTLRELMDKVNEEFGSA